MPWSPRGDRFNESSARQKTGVSQNEGSPETGVPSTAALEAHASAACALADTPIRLQWKMTW